MLRNFISYYKPYRKMFFIDMVCALFVAVCNLIYPYLAKDIINVYVPEKNLRMILIWGGILLGIYLIKALLNFIIQYWGHLVGVGMQGDMRSDLFRKLQSLPFSFFDDNKTGSLMSRVTNDLQDISELAHHGPEDLFLSLLSLVGAFFIMWDIDWRLTLIVYAAIPFVVLFAVCTRKEMMRAFKLSRQEIASVNAELETSISGIRVSKSYTAEDSEQKKFDDANDRFRYARKRSYRIMGIFFSGMGLMTDILYLLTLVAAGIFFLNGEIDPGEFAAFLLYISMFLDPIKKLINIFEQLQNGMTGFARFREIMDQEPEEDCENPEELGKVKGEIRFDNVTFSYREGDEKPVIDNLSLSIVAGRTVALVGPSGGGKTTLCNLIPRFYEIDGGSITLDGHDIRNLRRRELRQNIGTVAQDVFLFEGTVRENILFGKPDATEEEMIEAAKKAEIHDFVSSLPEGYDTNVGERGVRLSGGQKQRISIARVFLKDPAILILDEATSALDNVTEQQIRRALDKLSEGRTGLIVAHRLSTVKNADEIIVLTAEGVAERGNHEQLLAQDGIYADLYRSQFKED
ncbi:MAG: ABC transporter ATP-binding protein [Clostridia bacterium]|nr:ABC transporter ATP-binding protein [Clostridia bacterium]